MFCHTFCYVPCPYGGIAQNIENRSFLYTSLGFNAHSTKTRTRIAYATVENGCVKNRLLVIVLGVAMDTSSSPAPENKSAPQKKMRRAFGASTTLARRRLSNKRKFESRTGQNVAAASAVSNTECAIERGGRTLDEQRRPFYLGGHRAQQQRLRH